jgi:hypothetical protein
MQKQTYASLPPYQLGEAAVAASRNLWLAGLGATIVTRDWVQHEAGPAFRTLVKQGTLVESRAIRFVGDQVETSFDRANAMWKQTRRTVEATVKQAANAVVDVAQQVLPRSLPAIELPKAFAPAKRPAAPAKRARKVAKRRTAKRAAKRTTKRA